MIGPRPGNRFPRHGAPVLRVEAAREIKISTTASGERVAFYRVKDARSLVWRSLPLSRAERALRTGRLVYAGLDSPAIEHVAAAVSA